jgi:hypothetical protein
MGAVFIARLEGIEARHAVKIVALGDGPAAATRWARFEREAHSLSRLNHAGVVPVHAFGLVGDGEFGYLAMDWVKGENLEELQDRGLLSQDQELKIIAGIAYALAHVHDAGIMHRDVKPANVIVRADTGLPVLCDFGLVRDERDASLTKSQQLLGTPRFMAPELVTGDRKAQGPATDVFALGVMLYATLSGEYPFSGEDLPSLAGQILTLTPKFPSAWRSTEHRGLDPIVLAALGKEPASRPSAADVADAIERSLRGELHSDRTWNWLLVALGALAVILSASIAGVASTRTVTGDRFKRPAAESTSPPEPPREVALRRIAAGDGPAAMAAVTSALTDASPGDREALRVLEARALLLCGEFEAAAKNLPPSESTILDTERARLDVDAKIRARLGDPMGWPRAYGLATHLFERVRGLDAKAPLANAIRSRAGETLALIILDAPTGDFSPVDEVDTCVRNLASLLGDDPRVAIIRAVIHEARVPVVERGRSIRPLPSSEGLTQRWRYTLTCLNQFAAVEGEDATAALETITGSPPGLDPLDERTMPGLERDVHYHYRQRLAAFARTRFLKALAHGNATPESHRLAVAYGELALSVSGGFVPERRRLQLISLAELALCVGRYERVNTLLRDVHGSLPEVKLRLLTLRVERLLELGQLDAAAKLLKPAIGMSQTCADVWTLDARISHAVTHPGKAKRLLDLVPAANILLVPWRSPEITRKILDGEDPRARLRRRP